MLLLFKATAHFGTTPTLVTQCLSPWSYLHRLAHHAEHEKRPRLPHLNNFTALGLNITLIGWNICRQVPPVQGPGCTRLVPGMHLCMQQVRCHPPNIGCIKCQTSTKAHLKCIRETWADACKVYMAAS